MKNWIGSAVIGMALLSGSALSASEIGLPSPPTQVERIGTHIYYRTSWAQLSQNDQRMVIDQSVELLKNELSDHLSHVTGLKKLSSAMLSDKVLDDLATEAQKSVQYADTHSLRGLLPSALLLYGG